MSTFLACDVDGVTANFAELLCDGIYEVSGKRYQWQEIDHWNFWLKCGLSPNQCADLFAFIETPGMCESMLVMPRAKEGFARVQAVADVIAVTTPWASATTWAYERTQWLRHHLGLPANRVIHTPAKEFVSVDFFVDDHPGNVRAWNARNAGIGLLWTQPYNATIGDLPRVSNWEELVQLIEDSKRGIAA